MIVDCHTHVWEYPQHLSDYWLTEFDRIWGKGKGIEVAVDLEDHWRAMEGVSRAIVLAFRSRALGVDVPNTYVAEYVNKHPEKLIGFACVDPNDADAPEELEYCIKELGLKGLKLAPIYQHFDPLDEKFYPLYQKAQDLQIPILWHQGTTFLSNAPLKYASPVLLDEIAQRFPQLKMIIAHLGHPWFNEAVVVIRKHPNLYADISGVANRPWQGYQALVTAVEYGVADKLLFASDYPFSTPRETQEALRRINERVRGTNLPKVPEEVIEGIIHRPSLSLLGIES